MLEQWIWEILNLDIFSEHSEDVNWAVLLRNRVKKPNFPADLGNYSEYKYNNSFIDFASRKYQEELSDMNVELGLAKINIYLSGQSIYDIQPSIFFFL